MVVHGGFEPTRITQRSSRRRFVSSVGGALLISPKMWPAVITQTKEAGSLFTVGVASGDPSHHSIVLWTRLAPQPLQGGGLGHVNIPVGWVVARDPELHDVVRRGMVTATPYAGHAVKVVVDGLPSNSWLYYQFSAFGQQSRLGRTRTFPHPGSTPERMRFAVASCQNYTAGLFTAYHDMVQQNLDFVIHVDDYIYENGPLSIPLWPDRNHNSPELFSVEDYRNRYALYRLDPNLQAAHAHLPFIFTPDQPNEDNLGDNMSSTSSPAATYKLINRRRNAIQVFHESMPLTPTPNIPAQQGCFNQTRKYTYGRLADIHVLATSTNNKPVNDSTCYRAINAIPKDVRTALQTVLNTSSPNKNMVSASDHSLSNDLPVLSLAHDLYRSRALWNIIAQTTMVSPWRLKDSTRLRLANNPYIHPSTKATLLNSFAAVGSIIHAPRTQEQYAVSPERLFHLLDALRPRNPVILTGGTHSAWAAGVFKDIADLSSDMIAAEFVCTSISSTFGGIDPRPLDFVIRAALKDNQHIEFFNGLFRGYCLCDVDSQRWRTTFRGVGSLADLQNPIPEALVPKADSRVETDATVELASGFNQHRHSQSLITRVARVPVRE
ncbi:MAG: alkaline phosphatase D family protein [Myxococcales bacterium]|nr:alkaline phosphatase D family protein [Myxococcales bacterium]